jgi:hypothetical protein
VLEAVLAQGAGSESRGEAARACRGGGRGRGGGGREGRRHQPAFPSSSLVLLGGCCRSGSRDAAGRLVVLERRPLESARGDDGEQRPRFREKEIDLLLFLVIFFFIALGRKKNELSQTLSFFVLFCSLSLSLSLSTTPTTTTTSLD